MCGCETVSSLVRGDDAAREGTFTPIYWDGPRVRAGVALVIQVGTVASAPMERAVLVDQNGEITLPLLEEPVMCDGLTLNELKSQLVTAYSKFIRQPVVTVTFAPYTGQGVSPWGVINVHGQVGNQGPVNVPPTMDMTVTRVLQAAGGVKPYADTSAIVVIRCDKDGKRTRYKIDLDDIGKRGHIEKDIPLRAGDVVYVPETIF